MLTKYFYLKTGLKNTIRMIQKSFTNKAFKRFGAYFQRRKSAVNRAENVHNNNTDHKKFKVYLPDKNRAFRIGITN
ncbi:MAG: hypothetical protein BGO31_09745 [Bacteroidetes bacterium 43-16]|nr:MAG: hypothetical protein BGO31_09745 [Bacteroidetes bacterium 43-16]